MISCDFNTHNEKNDIFRGRESLGKYINSLKLMSKETNASTDNGGIVDYDLFLKGYGTA